MGSGTGGEGGGDRRDVDIDGQIIRREDTLEKAILETEPNATIAYALGLETHQPIMSMLGGHGGRLDRERESY